MARSAASWWGSNSGCSSLGHLGQVSFTVLTSDAYERLDRRHALIGVLSYVFDRFGDVDCDLVFDHKFDD